MSWTFEPLRASDLPRLHDWLQRRHVAEWWDDRTSLAQLTEDFGPIIAGEEPVQAFIALRDGEPAGFIQSYVPALDHADGWWLDVHDPGVRGIDQFLADGDALGRGLGTAMIRVFCERLFADPAVTRIQADPSPENARALRCYEKVGFRRVGAIETPDGPAMLMRLERR